MKNNYYLEMLEAEIARFRASPERAEALAAARYYRGEHDIQKRCRTAIGGDGSVIKLDNMPCARITDNQFTRLVDQKINYSLGVPFTADTGDGDFAAVLSRYTDAASQRLWRAAATEAMTAGIAWLHPYINESGALCLRRFDGASCFPLWSDAAHTTLDALVRLCPFEYYSGRHRHIGERVFVYTRHGTEEYKLEGGRLCLIKKAPHMSDTNGRGFNWDCVPAIAVRYNHDCVPMIRRVKALQDALNTLISEFCDNMSENSRSTVLVLRNFDGEDLSEFRRNLAVYGAVKVRSEAGADGGVDTLRVEVNADNYDSLRSILTEAITEACRGFDSHDGRLGSNPNRMNVLALYSDIDLDANGFECELACAWDVWCGFIRSYFYYTRGKDFTHSGMKLRFYRKLLLNDAQA